MREKGSKSFASAAARKRGEKPLSNRKRGKKSTVLLAGYHRGKRFIAGRKEKESETLAKKLPIFRGERVSSLARGEVNLEIPFARREKTPREKVHVPEKKKKGKESKC